MVSVEVSEAYTSQRCSRCGAKGKRYKGQFECGACGLNVQADKNGAHNSGRRALGKFSRPLSNAGDAVARPGAGSYDFSPALQENERKATSAA